MVEAPRLDMTNMAPEAYRHLLQLEGVIGRHVDPTLYHLIKLRASQINGCAFCLQMHTAEALKDGETPSGSSLLDAWEESPLYTDKERAALAWTEELTLIADSGASSESFEALKAAFQRGGDRLADPRRGPDQQLEPDRNRDPRPIRSEDVCRRSGAEDAGTGLKMD